MVLTFEDVQEQTKCIKCRVNIYWGLSFYYGYDLGVEADSTKLNELVALWVSMFRGSNKGVGMYQVGSKHKSFT